WRAPCQSPRGVLALRPPRNWGGMRTGYGDPQTAASPWRWHRPRGDGRGETRSRLVEQRVPCLLRDRGGARWRGGLRCEQAEHYGGDHGDGQGRGRRNL